MDAGSVRDFDLVDPDLAGESATALSRSFAQTYLQHNPSLSRALGTVPGRLRTSLRPTQSLTENGGEDWILPPATNPYWWDQLTKIFAMWLEYWPVHCGVATGWWGSPSGDKPVEEPGQMGCPWTSLEQL